MADIAASGSPSSRRAWIEIGRMPQPWAGRTSPSSRRAWIEIRMSRIMPGALQVALLAEGVDRNIARSFLPSYLRGRPPRGGRG